MFIYFNRTIHIELNSSGVMRQNDAVLGSIV